MRYYGIDEVKPVDGAAWRLELAGAIENKQPWTKDALYALPQETQITRLVCVEGWDYIGKWSGVPLRTFLDRIGADKTAKYVGFKCADKYWGSIDMATRCIRRPSSRRIMPASPCPTPTVFQFVSRRRSSSASSSPKWIYAMEVTNAYPGGYWEDGGYNWFSGL